MLKQKIPTKYKVNHLTFSFFIYMKVTENLLSKLKINVLLV